MYDKKKVQVLVSSQPGMTTAERFITACMLFSFYIYNPSGLKSIVLGSLEFLCQLSTQNAPLSSGALQTSSLCIISGCRLCIQGH